jgi:crotonobetainyl-CoA:carnitine CoA-transferase CaiB-like acyl-CoA transferase
MSQDFANKGGGGLVAPHAYPHAPGALGVPTDTLVRAGTVGALVGATGALASTWPRLREGGPARDAALKDVAVTAGKTGLATGLGALAANSLRGGPLISAAVMVATGAVALRLMSKGRPGAKQTQDDPQTRPETGETA